MAKNRRALVSVSDKTGLIPLARAFRKHGIEILSTGGTLKALKEAGITCTPVEAFTGFPEILEGRVKTLHPKIHGGLLYRRDKKSHREEALRHGIAAIDFVVVNLYPFEQVARDPSAQLEKAVENIDIGGPSMLRSAAKNFDSVTVVSDPADYPLVVEELERGHGRVSAALRGRLARKVFERTAHYDRAIAHYLAAQDGKKLRRREKPPLPEQLDVPYRRARDLRYGENPHQRAALYTRSFGEPRLHYEQLHGKELSYNNLLDIEAAIDVMREFAETTACVIKHTNPCGIAQAGDPASALELAIECDAMSAFGGIVGVNTPCDLKTVKTAFERLPFFEIFVAPSFEPPALAFLKERRNLRLIATGPPGEGGPYDMRFMKSGILLQDRDLPIRLRLAAFRKDLRVVTRVRPKPSEIEDLIFAFQCVKLVKSNAIVLTQGRQTVGIGAGQMSRVDAVEIACRKAGYRAEGASLASDAFFPMPDSIETAHPRGVKAVIQPGGSIRDEEVIAACDRLGLAMVFTGERHFRH